MSISKIMLSFLMAVFLGVCAVTGYKCVSFHRWEFVADSIDAGEQTAGWSDGKAEIVAKALDQFPQTCRWRDRKIEATLALSLLDRVIASPARFEERTNIFEQNINFFKETARCSPLRHNNWTNLARLEAVASFNVESQEKLIRFARILAPTQLSGLMNRVEIYGVIPGMSYLIKTEAVQKDLLDALRYGRQDTLVTTLKSLKMRNVDLVPIFERATQTQLEWLKKNKISVL